MRIGDRAKSEWQPKKKQIAFKKGKIMSDPVGDKNRWHGYT